MSEKYRIVLYDDMMMDKQFYVSKESSLRQIQWTDNPKYATTFGSFTLAEKVRDSLLNMMKQSRADGCTIEIENVFTAPKSEPPPPSEPKEETKAQSEPLSDAFKGEGLEWKTRICVFGISFDMAIDGEEMLYRLRDENGKIRTQKREGKDVARDFCACLYGNLCVKLDRFEQRKNTQ